MRRSSLRCWLLRMSLSWVSLLIQSQALFAQPYTSNTALTLEVSSERLDIHAPAGWQLTIDRWSLGRQRSEAAGAWALTAQDRAQQWQLERDGVTQHYQVRPEGLSHSVYVEQAPAGVGELYFRQKLRSAQLKPTLVGADAILWRALDAPQDRVSAYHGEILAWDVTGRPLPARYELDSQEEVTTLSYVVDDTLAIYPVIIDPLLYEPEQGLAPPQAQAARRFGEDVAIYEDTMVIGAPGDDTNGTNSGALYVYSRRPDRIDQWSLDEVLTGTTQAQDKLGTSVAINHDTIAALALGANGGQGQLNIFARDTSVMGSKWRHIKTIDIFSLFGLGPEIKDSLALNAQFLAVGYMDKPNLPSRRSGVAIFSRHKGGLNAWDFLDDIQLQAPPGDSGFGEALAWGDDDILLIGSPRKDSGQPNSGAAYLYEKRDQSWSLLETLTPPQPQTNQRFGYSVAIAHGRALIGAPGQASQEGVAYLFERNQGGADSWGLKASITPPQPQQGERFGFAVGLIGERAIVSASEHAVGADTVGAIYQFERDEDGPDLWGIKRQHLGQEANAGFGHALAISEREIITGQSTATVQGVIKAGSLVKLELERSSWPQRLLPPQAAGMGQALAMSADLVLVGAPLESGQGLRAGAAYVYDVSMMPDKLAGLSQQLPPAVLLGAGEIGAGDRFGAAVALGDRELFVGAPQDSSEPLMGARPGEVHVYTQQPNGWAHAQLLSPPAPVSAAHFGQSLARDGQRLYVGAPKQQTMGQAQGAVYVYQRSMQTGQWQLVQTLYSPTPQDTEFGGALSAQGGELVVGAAGRAYHYKSAADPTTRTLTLSQSYTPSQAEPTFGAAVSLSPTRLLIGAPGADDLGQDAGEVHVYARAQDGSYAQLSALRSDAHTPGARFGSSLAQDQRWALIGEPGASLGGRALLYEQLEGTTWAIIQTYLPDDQLKDARHQLGATLALFGGTMLLGAPGAASSTDFIPGRLYLSQDLPLAQTPRKVLNAPTPMAMARFGEAIDAKQGWLFVGAPGEDQGKGAVYIFERNQGGAQLWGLLTKLSSPTPEINGHFGESLKLSGERLVVGAPGELNGKGRAYLFERNALGADVWGLSKTITSPLSTAGRFGTSVSLAHTTLVIGAPAETSSATDGSVFIYTKDHTGINQWGMLKNLSPSTAISGGRFGQQTQLEQGRLLVTQPPKTPQGSGAVYIFEADAGGAQQWGMTSRLANPSLQGFAMSATLRADQLFIGAPESQTISHYTYDSTWSSQDLIDLGAISPNGKCGDTLSLSAANLYTSCVNAEQTLRLTPPRERRPNWMRDHVSLGPLSAHISTIDYIVRGDAQALVSGVAQAGAVTLESLEVATAPAPPTILAPTPSINAQPLVLTGQSQPLAWLWLQVQDLQGATVWSGTTRAQDDGAWTHPLPQLPVASYKLIARARAQDKLSTISTRDFTLEQPLFVSIDSPLDATTINSAMFMLSGRATAGTTITLKLTGLQGQGDISATYQADMQGRWQGSSPSLIDGSYELTAIVVDGAQLEMSAPVHVVIDTTPPTLVWDTPLADTASNTSTISAQGNAEPGATLMLTLRDEQGNVVSRTTTTINDATGQWSATLMMPLAEGKYTLSVEVTDSAGNVTTQQRSWSYDTTAPTILVLKPDAQVNNKTPQISGTTEPRADIAATLRCATGTPQSIQTSADLSGAWSFSAAQPLAEGRCDVELIAQDLAGNSSALTTHNFIVDTLAPALTLDAPLDDATLNTQRPTISGTVDQRDISLALYFGQELTPKLEVVPTLQGDRWSYTASEPLLPGRWRAVAAAVDAASNVATAEVSFTLEAPQAPTLKHLEPKDETITNHRQPLWVVQISTRARLELLVDGARLVDLGEVQGTKSWSGPYPQPLSDGDHTLSVRAHYGDDQIITTPIKHITVDTLAPSLSMTSPAGDELVEDNTPVLMGLGEPSLDIELFVDDVRLGQTKIAADGRWRWPVALPGLSDGAHSAMAQGQDRAGNMANSGIVMFQVKAPVVITEDPKNTGDQPTFSGEAPEGSKVTIIIVDSQGQEIHRGTTTAGADKTWRYKVDEPLPDGDYIVIVEIEQPDGKKKRRTLTLNIRRYTPDEFARSYCSLSQGPRRSPSSPTGLGLGLMFLGLALYRRARHTRQDRR